MKKGNLSKAMALMVALVMVITMIPTYAFAMEQDQDQNPELDGTNTVSDQQLDPVVDNQQEVSDEVKTMTDDKAVTDTIKEEKPIVKEKPLKDDGKLDVNNLEDGTYIVKGDMVKVDRKQKSMANNAFNHNVRLTVENGHYYITLDFKGMKIGDKFGYLGTLKYFLSGYTTNQFGRPEGELRKAKVESVQKDAKGNVITDDLGTNYPDIVKFDMIPEALEDGCVPLQVFVPIMESIGTGLGSQEVYLKLNWNTIEKTTEEDDRFIPEKDDNQVVNPGNKPNNTIGNNPAGTDMENPPVVRPNMNTVAPATGDANSMLPWMLIAVAAGTAVVALRKKEN